MYKYVIYTNITPILNREIYNNTHVPMNHKQLGVTNG